MVANEIAEDRQVHVFLAVVGPQAYKLLKNLCDPDNPNGKSYEDLKQILQTHYEPAPIVIAKTHKLIIIIIIIYRFLERHILKALWRFTILKINKKLQKTIKSLSKKKGLKAPFECI